MYPYEVNEHYFPFRNHFLHFYNISWAHLAMISFVLKPFEQYGKEEYLTLQMCLLHIVPFQNLVDWEP